MIKLSETLNSFCDGCMNRWMLYLQTKIYAEVFILLCVLLCFKFVLISESGCQTTFMYLQMPHFKELVGEDVEKELIMTIV